MKILLADDHVLIRSGLRNELRELGEGSEFLEAWDADTLRRVLNQHRDLDLALIDLTMPGMQGSQTISALCQDYPTVPLIVISAVDADADVRAVLRAGAAGFIPKASMAKVMLQAIRLVLAGGQYLPPQLMHMLDGRERDVAPTATEAGANTAAKPAQVDAPTRLALLSPRQREVFALLATGLSNKMIARKLGITEGTVKSHVATIFDVLHVHNRVSAVAEAQTLSSDPEVRRLLGGG
jgi:DNA-binding NarL/FixJ family response regulator